MTDEGNRGRRNYRHGGAGTSRDDGGRDRPVPRDGTGVRTADRVSGGTIESSQLGAEGLGRPAGGTGETAAGVEIVEVVQTLPIRAGSTETEQLVFTIAE